MSAKATYIGVLASSAIGRGLPFVAFVLLARSAEVSVVADLAGVMAFTTGVGAVCSANSLLAGARDLSRSGKESFSWRDPAQSYLQSMPVVLVFVVLVLAGEPLNWIGLPELAANERFVLAAATATSPMSLVSLYFLTGAQRTGAASWTRVVKGSTTCVGLLSALAFDHHVIWFTTSLIAGDLLCTSLLCVGFAKRSRWSSLRSRSTRGGPTSLADVLRADMYRRRARATLLAAVTLQCGTLLAFGALRRSEEADGATAAFAVTQRWQLLLMFVPSSLAPLFVARLTRAEAGTTTHSEMARIAKIYLTVLGLPAMLLLIFSGPLARLTGPDLPDLSATLRLGAVAALAQGANMLASHLAVARNEWRPWTSSDILFGVLLLVLGPLLAASHGPGGLLWVQTAGALASASYLWWVLERRSSL